MKKEFVFVPALLIVGILLFLLRKTGMDAHIAISLAGIIILVAYTVLTKKNWKVPALEMIMRVCYGIALISGIVIKKVHGIAALAITHKAAAALFVVLLMVLFVHKLIAVKKA